MVAPGRDPRVARNALVTRRLRAGAPSVVVVSPSETSETPGEPSGPPVTPDGRYLVVRGRLWRRSDPRLDGAQRERLVAELMDARRAKGAALRAGDDRAREAARQ